MNFRDKIEEVKPREIEEKSFAIISEELGARAFAPHTELIVKRCIHTSADCDYAENLCFSPEAAEKAMDAIRRGVSVVTDTNMAKAGINKVSLAQYGGSVHCLGEPFIYAIGNAPTALVSLYDLMQEGKVKPELIIGVPVGFVNVVQSKELIMSADVPYIVARGRKGGSNIAACIVNALLYMIDNDRYYWTDKKNVTW